MLDEKEIEESAFESCSLGQSAEGTSSSGGFLMEANVANKESAESPRITVNDLSSDTSGDGIITEKNFDIYK